MIKDLVLAQKIIDIYNTGTCKSQSEIARKVRCAQSSVSSVIVDYKKKRGSPINLKTPPSRELQKQQSITLLGMTIKPEELGLLQASKNKDAFVQLYYQRIGFEKRSIDALHLMWARYQATLSVGKPNKGKIVKIAPKVMQIIEKAKGEVGSTPSLETLVSHTNNALAEQTAILLEIKTVQEHLLRFFENEQKRVIAEKAAQNKKTTVIT
jgi:hypothetical protein